MYAARRARSRLSRPFRPQHSRTLVGLPQHIVSALTSHHLNVSRIPEQGRALIASAPFQRGDVVLTEREPLAWAAAARDLMTTCAACLCALPERAVVCSRGCGARYCSAACREAAWASGGHELLCGSEASLDAWCADHTMNFPRVAAALVARSLSPACPDFNEFWGTVHCLAFATPPSSDEDMPRAFREGYAEVRAALTPKLGGGAGDFWELILPLRVYARVMGTLRLNAFSVPCPLGGAAPGSADDGGRGVAPGGNSSSVSHGGRAAAEGLREGSPSLPAAARANDAADQDGGCASSNGASGACGTEDSGCGTAGGSSCSPESAATFGDAPGGTALYACASFANHECEPNCDVLIARGGALGLRARRDIKEGEPVTITYLDSSLPVALRRKKLEQSYGFQCSCSLCVSQLHG